MLGLSDFSEETRKNFGSVLFTKFRHKKRTTKRGINNNRLTLHLRRLAEILCRV
jgi:hypothetical protein